MNKIIVLVLSLFLFCSAAMAETSGFGLSLGYGNANSSVDVYRLGLKKDFPMEWFQSDYGYFSGFFELSYNHWEHSDGDIECVGLSPVFVYYFGDKSNTIRPYIEGGVGVAYINKQHIAGRDLSTNFQFEDRVGVGAKIGVFDFNLRYMHYSNASIKSPNDGLNIWMVTTSIEF